MPPKQNPSSKPAPKKKSKTKTILIVGCLVLLLMTCGGCGAFSYFYLYKPGLVGGYLNKTADSFNEVSDYSHTLDRDLNGEKLENVSTKESFGTEERIKALDEFISRMNTLLGMIEKAKGEIPESPEATEELDKELKEYYDLLYDFWEEDKEFFVFLKEFDLVFKKAKDIGLEGETTDDIRKTAKEFQEIKQDFLEIKENEYTKDLKVYFMKTLDGLTALYNKGADAMDKMDQATNTGNLALFNEAEQEYEQAVNEFGEVMNDYKENMDRLLEAQRNNYNKKVDELNAKQDSVIKLAEELEGKHSFSFSTGEDAPTYEELFENE